MATKVLTHALKVGMFVADLDRPWVDTPFLLQGFLIEDDEQIAALRAHCDYVMVDRARSTGDEYEGPITASVASQVATASRRAPSDPQVARVTPNTSAVPEPDQPAPGAPPRTGCGADRPPEPRIIRLNTDAVAPPPRSPEVAGEGLFGRLFGRLRGGGKKEARAPAASPPPQPTPQESAAEFEARAALAPPGITIITYVDEVSVEAEVPRAREVVAKSTDLLEKLVADIRLGQNFEIDRVEEIVDDMVESIVRNPDALMWVARLREQDIGTYGHGLQVSVYLTSFGRHLGFPK